MVTLITGPRDSGKSTHFLRLYQEAGGTDMGVFSQKRLDASGNVEGYDLVLLPSGESFPLARLDRKDCSSIDETDIPQKDCWYQGRFVFSRLAFERATAYILNKPSSTVWIDEVGKLELRGLGYAHLIRQLLEMNIDITLTIRESYTSAFFTTFIHILNE